MLSPATVAAALTRAILIRCRHVVMSCRPLFLNNATFAQNALFKREKRKLYYPLEKDRKNLTVWVKDGTHHGSVIRRW